MSDIPNAEDGGEELDLGEIEDEGQEDDAEGDGGNEADAGGNDEQEEGQGEEADGDVAAAPQRRGRESQSQRLRRQLADKERELAEAKGYRQAAEQFQQRQSLPQIDPAAQQRAAEERANRLAMMSQAEAIEFVASEERQRMQQALLYQHLQMKDELDKRDYNQQARTSRDHERYRSEVEAELARKHNGGDYTTTREEILDRLVGRDARARASRAAPSQRRAAARRVAGAQARPTGARGDGASGGRRPAPGTPEHDDMLVAEFFRSGGTL